MRMTFPVEQAPGLPRLSSLADACLRSRIAAHELPMTPILALRSVDGGYPVYDYGSSVVPPMAAPSAQRFARWMCSHCHTSPFRRRPAYLERCAIHSD